MIIKEEKKARMIAFYLPQFHPIPENNLWWGEGFTEWTNVGKARPLYKGHYQPRVPADLGYYDLRVPESRRAQADLAKEHGVEGFCYWHYWFGNGKRLLEKPIKDVLDTGEPDFPFCFAWANESWKGFAHGLKNRNMLIEQLYPGNEDVIAHFNELLPYFKDNRYITVHGKQLFMVYKPFALPDPREFIATWQKLAQLNGLKGLHFVAQTPNIEEKEKLINLGFDAVNIVRMFNFVKERQLIKKIWQRLKVNILNTPKIFNYSDVISKFHGKEDSDHNVYPSVFPNWDHTPRSGIEGIVLHDSKPELFEIHVKNVVDLVKQKNDEEKLVFVKSWNEWAEGNYLEPDLRFGKKYLEVLKRILK